MGFVSPRERRLWALCAGYLALLYASLPFTPLLISYLQGRGLLEASVALLFGSAGMALLLWISRQRPTRREIGLLILFFIARVFPLKAQDRAIRAEENLRHYVLTGKLLDARLTPRQIIGLRFAADEEFVELAHKAAEENLSEDAIKKAIKNWRPDTYRV